MKNLEKISEELNKKYNKNLSFIEVFSDEFIDALIIYHLNSFVDWGVGNESAVSLHKRTFFFNLPCRTYANQTVIKQVHGSPWKDDGSFNPQKFLINEDVVGIIETLHYKGF